MALALFGSGCASSCTPEAGRRRSEPVILPVSVSHGYTAASTCTWVGVAYAETPAPFSNPREDDSAGSWSLTICTALS